MTDSTIPCDQCGTEFEPKRDVEAALDQFCFDCAVRQIRKERQGAANADITLPGVEGEELSQEPPFEIDSGGAKYRVEAEVQEPDYAHILKQTIEDTAGCRLTAFDKQPEVDNVE